MLLIDKIREAQNGNEIALLDILEKFRPLLVKYARKMRDEDAFYNLQLALIQLIKKFNISAIKNQEDKYILSYIRRSIQNAFFEISSVEQKANQCSPFTTYISDFEESGQQDFIDKFYHVTDEYLQIQYDLLARTLTPYEAQIIIYYYQMDYSVKEIAAHFNVSLPAISQAKSNALRKLKEYMKKEGGI